MTVEVKSEGVQMADTVDSRWEQPAVVAVDEPLRGKEEAEEEKGENPVAQPAGDGEEKPEKPTPELEEKQLPDDKKAMEKSSSFREESNFLSDLKETERKALAELRAKLAEINGEVSLWEVPLSPSKSSDATDVVLLKFLRAREFRVKESFEMLQSTLKWRREEKIDSILEEADLGVDYASACYMDGCDREGRPVCYNLPGVFADEEVYKEAFGSEEGRRRFVRWRVQVTEKGIRLLDLKPGGVLSLLQVTDLKDSVGPSKKALRETMKQALQVLQDNYPEFVAKNIMINVPFWYYAFHALLSPFLTQRTKSKFVFARPSQVTETLLKYIPAEAIPICYGGFKRENEAEFSVEDDKVSELVVKSNATDTIELPAPEVGTTLIWDLSVLGWEVNYKEEFVPTDEGSYTIIVQKGKKMGRPLEETIRNSFRNSEPGKIVLTIENKTFKKKKVLYRYKTSINA